MIELVAIQFFIYYKDKIIFFIHYKVFIQIFTLIREKHCYQNCTTQNLGGKQFYSFNKLKICQSKTELLNHESIHQFITNSPLTRKLKNLQNKRLIYQ